MVGRSALALPPRNNRAPTPHRNRLAPSTARSPLPHPPRSPLPRHQRASPAAHPVLPMPNRDGYAPHPRATCLLLPRRSHPRWLAPLLLLVPSPASLPASDGARPGDSPDSPSGLWWRPALPSCPPFLSTPLTSPRYAGDPVVASFASSQLPPLNPRHLLTTVAIARSPWR
uniref:Uncharacterized protein n=1 Tax=Zea mays TaxID=4577 RepID=A0A804QBF3_MAIZE